MQLLNQWWGAQVTEGKIHSQAGYHRAGVVTRRSHAYESRRVKHGGTWWCYMVYITRVGTVSVGGDRVIGPLKEDIEGGNMEGGFLQEYPGGFWWKKLVGTWRDFTSHFGIFWMTKDGTPQWAR